MWPTDGLFVGQVGFQNWHTMAQVIFGLMYIYIYYIYVYPTFLGDSYCPNISWNTVSYGIWSIKFFLMLSKLTWKVTTMGRAGYLPSGNEMWQWNINHLEVFFQANLHLLRGFPFAFQDGDLGGLRRAPGGNLSATSEQARCLGWDRIQQGDLIEGFFFMVHQWGNEQHGIFHRYFPIAIRSFFGFREIFVEWVGFERNTAPEFSGSQRHDPTTPNGSNMVNPVARYQHAWTDRDTGWNLFPTKKLPVGSEWSNYHPFGYPKIFDLYSATCGPCVARLDRS